MIKRQRKIKKKASAILSADWHIRPDQPICRTDNFFSAMNKKIDFILDLSKENDCPILIGGDLGNKPLNNGWPTWLLEWALNKFHNYNIISIAGQHDLENHKLDRWDKCGIGVLNAGKAIRFIQESLWEDCFRIYPFHFGQEITPPIKSDKYNIAMTHQMIVENKDLFPDQNAVQGHEILKKYPEYSLILSGDNHTSFIAEHEGRLLVNPGSLMRSTAAQAEHRPRVYLWYADTNEIECIYLPIEEGVISREHIKEKQDRENRYDSFIERLKNDVELELSFEDNISNYLKKYRTEKPVTDKIWRCVK